VNILVKSVFDIAASRPGLEIWKLDMQEVEMLTGPLANILARHNLLEGTSEYADYIALAIAGGSIFIPRYIAMEAAKPKKSKGKEQPNANRRSDTGGTAPDRPAGTRPNESHVIEAAGTRSADGPSLLNELSVLQPI
jgi:hypothetical protein